MILAEFNWQPWAIMLLTVVVFPSIAWLLAAIVGVQRDLATFKAGYAERMKALDANCKRHLEWDTSIQERIDRMNNNIVRLCQKADVDHE